jgi:hypothetical protein
MRKCGHFLASPAAAVAVNLAGALWGRVGVNLNYTVTSAVLQECCWWLVWACTDQPPIHGEGQSRSRLPTRFLEDIKDKISFSDKLLAA